MKTQKNDIFTASDQLIDTGGAALTCSSLTFDTLCRILIKGNRSTPLELKRENRAKGHKSISFLFERPFIFYL